MAFVAIMTECGQVLTTTKGMTQWRNEAAYGPITNRIVPPAPIAIQPAGSVVNSGFVEQIGKVRERAMASLNYTLAIGEELGFVGPEISPRSAADVRPELKSVTASGRNVTITGSMQGYNGMNVYYAERGGAFVLIKTITSTPAVVTIPTTTPNTPVLGQIRAQFEQKNLPYGEFSPDFNVTLT